MQTHKRITIRLTLEDTRLLDLLCKLYGESQSNVIRRLLSKMYNEIKET